MTVYFHMDDDEGAFTPIKVAEALIEYSGLAREDLMELSEYLLIYTRYNHDSGSECEKGDKND